jgi:holo-[acyl-carrier protein] synthase
VKLGAVGIDLVDVTRIAHLIARYGDRFLIRVLGPDEIPQLGIRRDRSQFVSGRFAAKEAAIKALGHYLTDRPPLTKIQIVNDATGRPSLDLAGLALPQLRNVSAQLSISHERSHAIAIVILTEES